MTVFAQYVVPFASTMVDGHTILEIPTTGIDQTSIEALAVSIENVAQNLDVPEIDRIIEAILSRDIKKFVLKKMRPYTAKRRSSERMEQDDATARYHAMNLVDDEEDILDEE